MIITLTKFEVSLEIWLVWKCLQKLQNIYWTFNEVKLAYNVMQVDCGCLNKLLLSLQDIIKHLVIFIEI